MPRLWFFQLDSRESVLRQGGRNLKFYVSQGSAAEMELQRGLSHDD